MVAGILNSYMSICCSVDTPNSTSQPSVDDMHNNASSLCINMDDTRSNDIGGWGDIDVYLPIVPVKVNYLCSIRYWLHKLIYIGNVS